MATPLPHPLIRQLQEFGQASERYVDAVSGHNHMHRTDMNALSAIMAHERAGHAPAPTEIGRELHLSSPATTALLDRLERSGHLSRGRHESDRRRVTLHLTEKAYADGRRMFAPLARMLMQTLESYSPDQIDLIHRFMADATAAVDAATAQGTAAGAGRVSLRTPPLTQGTDDATPRHDTAQNGAI